MKRTKRKWHHFTEKVKKKKDKRKRKMEETSLLQYHINYHQATWSCTQALSFHGLAVAALAWSRRVFRVQSKRSTGNLQAGVCLGTIHPGCNPNRPQVRTPCMPCTGDRYSAPTATGWFQIVHVLHQALSWSNGTARRGKGSARK